MAETVEERVDRLSKKLLPLAEQLQPIPSAEQVKPESAEPFRPVNTFVRPVLEGVGAAGGILAGTPLGPYGQAVGGALGYAGGSALASIAETAAGERPAPTSFPQALKETGEHLTGGALFEAGGQVTGKFLEIGKTAGKSLIRALVSGQAKAITPEQQLLVDTAQEMGTLLRPAEVTGSDVAAQVAQNARRSLFGRGKFQDLDERNSTALINFFDYYAEKVFGQQQSPQELGRLVQAAVKGEVIPDTQLVNRGLFQTLQQRTGNAAIVQSENILPVANELQQTFDPKVFPKSYEIAAKIADIVSKPGRVTGVTVKRGDVITSPELRGPLTGQPSELRTSLGTPNYSDKGFILPEESQLMGSVSGQGGRRPQISIEAKSEAPRVPKTLTFMEAHDARSMLLDLTRTGEVLSTREEAVASRLAKVMDTAMDTAATKFDAKFKTSIVPDWRIANASVRASHEIFDSAVIRKALSATPEDVVKVAFNRNAITETDRVLAAVQNSRHGLQSYQQGAFRELVSRSMKDGVINPQALYDAAYGRTGVGETVMQRTFKEHAPEMKRFLKTAERMNVVTVYQNVRPGQTGTTLVNWFEQGMILSAPVSVATGVVAGHPLAGVGAAGGVGIYAISVDQLARLVNSPRGLSLLTKAAGLSPTSQAGARVGGLLLKELAGPTKTP